MPILPPVIPLCLTKIPSDLQTLALTRTIHSYYQLAFGIQFSWSCFLYMALFPFLLLLARSFFAPRLELMAEILALRQQLAILNRTAKRPSLRFQDRLFWIALSRFWRDWRSALLIVKPETVIKWQLAFNLVAWFKRLILPAEFLTATIKTLRHRVFNLAGKIVTKSRQLFLVITDEYRFQDVWASVLNNLSELRLEAYP